GEVIAVSEGYKAKENCANGIESVKKNAPEAEVVEQEAVHSKRAAIEAALFIGP
ncbi:MAG: YegP family protein, partial [Oscillibacter sp.]|nr:YegP family protein [Oscillibacter sp.]